jgi:cytochrome c-type biogenesis protein CcmE
VARSTRSPARLIVALAVAGVLAVFLLYTAVAGNSTPSLTPSALAGHVGKVQVVGAVVGPILGDSHSPGGLRFGIRDIGKPKGKAVQVVYRGDSPPPLFAVTRHVVVSGTIVGGRIAGTGIVTKCPSKYVPTKKY